jgi:serine/threonine-protein kinase
MIVARRQDDPTGPLHLRRADELEFRELPGTERAQDPTFSPDGAWLAFEQDGEIKRVETAGGPVLPVATGFSPHWGAPDRIVFDLDYRLYSVAPTGGEPTLLLAADSLRGVRPFQLPGGAAVVFQSLSLESLESLQLTDGPIMLVELETGAVRDLGFRGTQPRYVPTGHLVFGISEHALLAVPFDPRRLEVTGAVFTVLPDVDVNFLGYVRFAVSDNGTALYALSRLGTLGGGELVEVDLDGTQRPTRLARGVLMHPRYSPDGRYIALERDGEIWVYDRETGESEPFSEGPGFYPVWSSDGRHIYYVDGGIRGADIVRRPADRSGPAEVVHTPDPDTYRYPSFASRTGDDFALAEFGDPARGMNLSLMSVEDDRTVVRSYLRAEYNELMPALSPDGRWVAYMSAEDPTHGRVYVRSFADATGGVLISAQDRAVEPVWAPDGSALYYRVITGRGMPTIRIMRAAVGTGDGFRAGAPQVLFDATFATSNAPYGGTNWDVHPDGQRFVMITAAETDVPVSAGLQMRLVVNWFEELRAAEGR